MTVAVAGAGWSGAVIARQLADAGHDVIVFEKRQHVAGNCHTERRRDVLVHAYGPHIFHTSDPAAWDWIQQWGEWRPYRLTVRATTRGEVFPLPVNLHTINQVYKRSWTPRQAAQVLTRHAQPPETFEDAAIAAVGEPIYRRLFAGYTAKQWGTDPSELPASVFHRLPVRFNYDDRYFTHAHEAMPVDGYTPVIRRILNHPLITVRTSSGLEPGCKEFDHVFWTGPLDGWFRYGLGRLRYRTTHFKWDIGDASQGVALMTWPDLEIPWTRVTEHNLLTPWESHEAVVRSFEYPTPTGPGDEPFYPLRLAHDRKMLDRYVELASTSQRVSFVGRLGTYRYLDMDVTIREALDAAARFLDGDRQPFYVEP